MAPAFLGGLLWPCCWALRNAQESAFLDTGGAGRPIWRLKGGKVRMEERTFGEEGREHHSPSLQSGRTGIASLWTDLY